MRSNIIDQTNAPLSSRPPKTLAAAFFLICAATYVLNAMDRLIFPAVVHMVAEEYHFDLATGGFLSTIFLFGIGFGGIVVGFVVDMYSRRTAMIAGVIIYSFFTLLTPMSDGFYSMLAFRAATGLGEGVQNVALATAVGAYYRDHRAFALGLIQCALGLGSFFGPVAAVWLISDESDWRVPFYVFGSVGFVGAGLLFLVPKTFTEQRGFRKTEFGVEDHIPDKVLNRNVICILVMGIFRGITFFGFLALYTTFLTKQLSFSFASASLALSLFGLGPFIGPIVGVISDRTDPKLIQILALLFMVFTGYLIFNIATTPLTQAVLAFLEGASGGVAFMNGYALAQRSVRSRAVGRVSGIFYASTTLPAAVSGWLFARAVEQFGWSTGGIVMTCCVLIMPIGATFFIDPAQLTGKRYRPVLPSRSWT